MGKIVKINEKSNTSPKSYGTGRVVKTTEVSQAPKSYGTKPTTYKPSNSLVDLAFESLRSGTLPATTQFGRVNLQTGAAAQRESMLSDYAQLSDDRKRERLESERRSLTRPGVVYNQETTEKNRARVQEIDQELGDLLPRKSGRLKSAAQSILSSTAGAIPALIESARSLDYSIGDEEKDALRSQLQEIEKQIRALEAGRTGTALSYIQNQDQWKRLDQQRREIIAQISPPVDLDSPLMQLTKEGVQYRQQALEGLEGVPLFLGETGLSIAQNAALYPLAAINPAAPLAAMSAVSAADRSYELAERGVPAQEAFGRSLISGGIEAATEKIPLDNLLEVIKTGGKDAIRNILQQMGTEATEESISYVTNYIVDKAYQDPEAEFSWAELAKAAAGGALSGGVFVAAGTGVNALYKKAYGDAFQQQEQQFDDFLMELAMESSMERLDNAFQASEALENETRAAIEQIKPEIYPAAEEVQTEPAPIMEVEPAPIEPAAQIETEPVIPPATVQEVEKTPAPVKVKEQEPAPAAEATKQKKPTPMPRAESEKPFTATLYHGSGANPADIYMDVQYPVAGQGRYYAMSEEQAMAYGDQVDVEEVTLENPIVVRDDEDWREVTGAAGWPYSNMFGASEQEVIQAADDMRKYILDSGHDGLVIQYDGDRRGDVNINTGGRIKTLDNVFGHDQVVVYTKDQPAVQTPAQAPKEEVSQLPQKPARGKSKKKAAPAKKESRSGNATRLMKKWAQNELVNINLDTALSDSADADTRERAEAYVRFFDKWYQAGMNGERSIDVVQNDDDLELPPFLQKEFYQAGKQAAAAVAKPPTEKTAIEKTEPAPDTPRKAPQQQIADEVKKYLEKGTQFSPARLFEIADKAYGGTMGQGTYTVKDAYDGMELAVNQYLMSGIAKDANGNAKTATAFLSKMDELLSKLPTQTKRTAEMESYQQFSTPPNIAYLAAWTANVNSSDVVLEPSAGIGGLALWPKSWGATVYANELSARRLEFLNQLGLDGTFNLNAEQIDNLLPDNIKPSVVIMNPPFSSTAGRTATNKTANAKRHIEQALERLEPGGRLVAILGRGMSDDAPSFKSWWRDIKQEYNVRANIQIDGSNYKKYGTTFDVQMVVIDKTGPTTGETITGTYKDLSQIPELMEGVRNDRQGTVRSGDAVSERTPGAVSVPGPVEPSGPAARPASETVPGKKQRGKSGNRTSDREGAGKRGAVRTQSEGDGEIVQSDAERKDGRGLDEADGGARMALSRSAGTDLDGRTSPDVLTEENIDSTYSTYVPQKVHIKGSKPHPAKLVESAAMAAVEPPDPTYTPSLPERIAKEGILSDAQLENVVYAGQAHSQTLADGRRKGFFIGDGTGVGKGRQIAGIIMDNFIQGRRKAVWISEKASLLEDAKRDWKDLGGNPDDVIDMKNPKLLKTGIQAESGIVFAPYTTLRSQKEARLKMLQEWLGKDFDGVIALDEAHNMGNSVVMKRGRGKTKPAAQAIAGIELQKAFPNARVVYASATGATDISQYGYLERLGLWGKGTAFNDLNDFIEKISNGGLAAMELVARDMKSMGVYMARSISYDDVKYDTIQHDLTPMQTEIYNTMSSAWQKVLQNVDAALKVTGADKNGQARGAAYSAIFSGQQRFYNQILTSMSMPSVIADMKKELAAGRSVVLQLTNTNEAQATRAIAKNEAEGGNLDDIDLTPSETLKDLLQKSFPVNLYEEYTDEDGRTKSRMVTDVQGNPIVDKKAVRMRDNLIAELSQMKVPDGPLEMLFDAFGPDQVAEVTGRTQRVVEKEGPDGVKRRVLEKRGPTDGLADTKMFQDGKKRILVFSEAGGTGKSYHSDLRAKNQQQRVHYLLQAGWNASKAVQGFGRTHRSNQASAPIFRLVTTNVMGQKRFTSTIARRLDQLGALTKGQRQAGSGVFSERDNLENPIAMDALSQYYKSVDKDVLKKLGLYDKLYDEYGRINESSDDLRNVSKFLNRILSLEVDEQNKVFQGFYDTFERMLDTAIANGTVDMGLENYKADKIDVVDENVIRTDKSGADTKYVQMVAYKKPDVVEYGQLENLSPNFVKLVRLEDGSVRAVYEMSSKTNEKGEVERRFKLQSPQLSKRSTYVETTLNSKTTNIPKKEWKSAWESEMKKVPDFEESTLHMLTGTLLPIWNRLPESNTRVMRVVTADGRQYLGRVIPPTQIDGVLRGLGSNRTKKTYTPAQVSEAVLYQGKQAILQDNRMKIVRRKVSGEWRMEVTGQNLWYLPRQISGIITERINYEYRYFIPTGENGSSVLQELISINPVLEIRAGDPEVDQMASGAAAKAYPDQWTAERVGSTDKTPMRLSDIVEKIRHDFGISITTGHIRGARTRGQYNRGDQGIRSKIANDLPTVAHELGHHLDNVYSITENLGRNLRAELINNLSDEMKAAYNKRKWITEGLAEYVRRFLQNRETAAIDYPNFTQHFLSNLNNTDGPLLEQLADEVNAYYSLDADTATSSIRFSEEGGKDFRTVSEKIKDMGDAFYQAWVDSNTGIRRFAEETGSLKPYRIATNAAYSDAMAGQIITGDLTDRYGRYVGPGLKTVLSGINIKDKVEYREFGEYLVVRHGPERMNEGLRVFADDRKNSTQFMERRRAELEEKYPEFSKAAERLYEFESQFLQTWGVNTGLVSQDSQDQWEERWQSYVPFNRAMDKRRPGARRGFANQSSGIKKAIGSGLDIVHPVDNVMFNVVRMVNAGLKNNVMDEIVKAAEKAGGMADFMEKVPMPIKRTAFNATGVKETLKQGVVDSTMSEADKDAAFDIIDNIDDILYQYGRGKARGDVVTVMKNGKPEYWKINDKMLLESVTSMTPAQAPAWLEAYGSVSRFMTSNITGNNVLWSIFSNSPRDLMTFFTYSKEKNPFKLLGGIGSAYANRLKGQNADPLYKEYLAMGGGKSSAYTADRSLAKVSRSKLAGSKLDYLNPMEWLSFVSDTIEMGPRYAYYKIMRERGFGPENAFYESADITVNFRRGGTWSRSLNKVIPFFNASVQGIDKFSRWIRAMDVDQSVRPKVMRSRAFTYVAASIALAAIAYGLNNRDEDSEEDYEQLSTYTKNSYWCIPLGDGKFFTIPKPRELAVLTSFFETSMEYFFGDNKHAFDEFYDYTVENALPNVISDVAKGDIFGGIGSLGLFGVGANMMANRDFMGRPIVSSGLQSLEKKDQYTNRTSQIAKSLGSAFNQSPQMIDYFFGQTLGGFWKAQKALFPVGKSEIDPTLGIHGTYIRDNQYSTDLVNWLYDTADSSMRAKNSDPENMEKQLDYKMDSSMSTFYSRYYAVSKDLPETTARRATRQTVLTMILDYQTAKEAGYKTSQQKQLEELCKSEGNTELMPSVMQNTIKDAKENTHTLSGEQYVEYQTDYLRIYWEGMESGMSLSMSTNEKVAVAREVKQAAAEQAKARALKRMGLPYDEKDADTGTLNIGEIAVFEVEYDMALGEIGENGKTVPGSKQEDVIEALESMTWLTDEEKSYLFRTKYSSDKNNPWS